MKNIKSLLIMAGIVTMGLISQAQVIGGFVEEQYFNYSQTIGLQGPNQIVQLRRLLNIQEGTILNNLIVVGSSRAGHGRLEILQDNQVIFQTNLSQEVEAFTIPIFKRAGHDLRSLQLQTFGNIKIFHVGLSGINPNFGPINPPNYPPQPPYRPQTVDIQCNSSGYRYKTCQVGGTVTNVILLNQTSRSQCILGSSYGPLQNQNAMWVDKGCAGVFRVEYF
jgi:hypothetical protein